MYLLIKLLMIHWSSVIQIQYHESEYASILLQMRTFWLYMVLSMEGKMPLMESIKVFISDKP